MKTIQLIGAPVDSGGPSAGCLSGPAALRQAGLAGALTRPGQQVLDAGDLSAQPLAGVAHPNTAISQLALCAGWVHALQAGAAAYVNEQSTPIFMGGDHLMAAGTIPALARHAQAAGRPLFVLWLDAHTDFHTLDSTDTGNLHGTPAAYVCGQPGFGTAFPPVDTPLDPANLCMLGIRSVDDAEKAWLEPLHTTLIDMPTLKTYGATASVQPFLDRVRAVNGLLHLSFDVDCLDPSIAPGVGTAVSDGVTLSQATELMGLLRESELVSSVDIAELNPRLDPSGLSANVMVALMASLFNGVPATKASASLVRAMSDPAELIGA